MDKRFQFILFGAIGVTLFVASVTDSSAKNKNTAVIKGNQTLRSSLDIGKIFRKKSESRGIYIDITSTRRASVSLFHCGDLVERNVAEKNYPERFKILPRQIRIENCRNSSDQYLIKIVVSPTTPDVLEYSVGIEVFAAPPLWQYLIIFSYMLAVIAIIHCGRFESKNKDNNKESNAQFHKLPQFKDHVIMGANFFKHSDDVLHL